MPFVRSERYDELIESERQLEGYLNLGPAVIGLAIELKDGLMRQLEDNPEATFQEIARIAYGDVYDEQRAIEIASRVADIEHEERQLLLEDVIKDLEEEDFDGILAGVRATMRSDPKLKNELRKKAHAELVARAANTVEGEFSDAHLAQLAERTEHQIALDELDLRFAHSGLLKLQAPEVADLVVPGDQLYIEVQDADKEKEGELLFRFAEDVGGRRGWMLREVSGELVNSAMMRIKDMPKTFIDIGSVVTSSMTEKRVRQPGLVERDEELLMVRESNGSRMTALFSTDAPGYYDKQTEPALIQAIDFHVRDLV